MTLNSLTIDETRLIHRGTEPVETTVGTEVVLMSLASGECFGLGETGSEIWRQLTVPMTPSQLIANLREQYEAPAGVLEQDVLDLLDDLQNRKLITLS